MLDLVPLGLGAACALAATAAVHCVLSAAGRGRVHGAASVAAVDPLRVHGVHGVPDAPDRVRTGRVHGPAGGGPGLWSVDRPAPDDGGGAGADAASDAAARPPEPPRPAPLRPDPPRCVLMGAADQIGEFLAFMLADGDRIEFTHRRMVQQYTAWARTMSVVPVPELTFLTLLARDPRVEKKRGARLKDSAGRVVRNASGTPVRPMTYVLTPPRRDVLPGKVPVGAVVPKWDLQPARRAA